MMRETDLYEPVKRFLEAEGYTVKAEVKDCDVVAQKPDAPMVIVELKLVFSLELVLQGVARLRLADDVYLAARGPDTPAKRRNWRVRQRGAVNLCRRLGLGLMLVDPARPEGRQINVLLDPAPYEPRKSKGGQTRLQKEFRDRTGDPNIAGISKTKIMTAYRQDAIRCAEALAGGKALKAAEIKSATEVGRASSILQKNHYGWFERISRSIYQLTANGEAAMKAYQAAAEGPNPRATK